MKIASLPFLDEHETVIAADADAVWRGLGEVLDRTSSRRGATAFVRLLGAADRTAAGPRPFAEGSTVPGFRVVTAVPGRELALVGRHRFSSYALVFRLESAGPGATRLCAESRARFPGPAGGAYRLVVVGTGGHVRGVRGLLEAVRRRSE
ncbi:hypothetical protein A8W25_01855 [Streptomyces sp. ERV7]|uniref:hypothetical protein n=1 Tax=Streptomyces sp. ERV7 TaxID=1322334 RepID=UPI0007F390D4|nr:hypothetical protein [Streptomyces sp. ERV7]OAR27046.1 hypothetical protein A8W25_01855 [Streptomyces sp. ERV7]